MCEKELKYHSLSYLLTRERGRLSVCALVIVVKKDLIRNTWSDSLLY